MKHRLSRARISLLFIIPSAVTVGAVAAILYGAPFLVILVSVVFAAFAWYGYMILSVEFEISQEGISITKSLDAPRKVPIRNSNQIIRSW